MFDHTLSVGFCDRDGQEPVGGLTTGQLPASQLVGGETNVVQGGVSHEILVLLKR